MNRSTKVILCTAEKLTPPLFGGRYSAYTFLDANSHCWEANILAQDGSIGLLRVLSTGRHGADQATAEYIASALNYYERQTPEAKDIKTALDALDAVCTTSRMADGQDPKSVLRFFIENLIHPSR